LTRWTSCSCRTGTTCRCARLSPSLSPPPNASTDAVETALVIPQFVLDRLNSLPATDHGIDFSRVKPWYLDGLSPFLRQSILLSSFDAPEIRGAWARACRNRAGAVRALGTVEGAEGVLERVPSGLRQVWTRFEVADVTDEDDRRFEWFTTKVRARSRSRSLSVRLLSLEVERL